MKKEITGWLILIALILISPIVIIITFIGSKLDERKN